MNLAAVQIALLAVVQGIAEFLPISSSGHIVILSSILGEGNSRNFDVAELNVVLHVGTLGSIVVVYFERIRDLLRTDRNLVPLLFLATLPAGAMHLLLQRYFGDALSNHVLAGFLLMGTGLLLLMGSRHANADNSNGEDAEPGSSRGRGGDAPAQFGVTYRQAFVIGCSQALAILPGLSRSGLTITTGMAVRLSAKSAATFSFLMAIPVIAAGGLLEVIKLGQQTSGGTPTSLLVMGCALSCLVGILSLRLLLRWLDRGRFHWFAWWCIPVGALVVITNLASTA